MMLRLLEASDGVNLGEAFNKLIQDTGINAIINDPRYLVMIAISCFLIYLAIVKKFEPLLLLPIAFGMLLVNLPLGGLMASPEGGDLRSGACFIICISAWKRGISLPDFRGHRGHD